MNTVLLNLLKEYRSVLDSSNVSHQDKLLPIKQMSSLLHNELFELFKEAMGLDVINDYNAVSYTHLTLPTKRIV